MISKEERAELRRLVSQEPVKTRDDHATLQTAVVLTLDALDAADERISVLESENRRALGLIDIGLAETAKWQELHGRTEDKLNARIVELEAAAQWRPIEEAPKSEVLLVAAPGTCVLRAYWSEGEWRESRIYEPLYFTPTHFRALPAAPIPALPEGGAK